MEDTGARDVKHARITPRSLPAQCSIKNKGALDWSPSGLLAYGCNYTIVVVDSEQLQIVQTLDKHRGPVVVIKWPCKLPTATGAPSFLTEWSTSSPLFLASGDSSGQIIIWNVISGAALHVLSDGNKPIQDLLWAQHFDLGEKYLLAVHPPSSLVVWDVMTGTKVYKKTYTEQLLAMDLDPFDPSRLAFLCPDCILLVEDFSLLKCPVSNGKKFYVSSPKTASTPSTPSVALPSSSDRSRDRLRKLVRDIIVGEAAPRPEEHSTTSLNDCLQLVFHRSLRHLICLVHPREVLLVDLRIHHTVAVLSASDRSYAPLQQLLLCRQRDVLFCVHESGSVSGRVRKAFSPSNEIHTPGYSPWNPPEVDLELHYEQRCLTESIRLTKNTKVLAAALHPLIETRLAILLSDGRLFFYDLSTNHRQTTVPLSEIISPLWMNNSSQITIRLSLSGLLTSLSALPNSSHGFVMKMCPALTVKNCHQYQPIVAVGCVSGAVQICDVSTGLVKKELAIHNYTVKGIEWTQLDEFLSYAQSAPVAIGGCVRNEVMLSNVSTGKTTTIRADRGEESPIELIRVSPLKQYFIIVFKESPPELWDLRHLTLVRTLPRRFPTITTLEWMPSHLQRLVKKTNTEDSDSSAQAALGISVKEFFVFSDPDGNLYHLTVDGSVVKDGARLSPPNLLNGIIAMAWKNELMALGDAEGNVAIWEWRTRHYRPLPHVRSPIKKLRFAPGKNNMRLLVLYTEGVDIWDVKENERLGQWRNCPFRDHLAVLDADWSASDKPLLACSDGSLRIFDVTLHQCNSPVAEYAQEPVLCPILMPRTAFQAAKAAVQLNLSAVEECASSHKSIVQNYLNAFSPISATGEICLPRQCLRAASLFGDQAQLDFWNVTSYYLRYFAGNEDLTPLDTTYDLLCDSATYRQMATERAALYQSKPRGYEQTRQLTRDHLLLNDQDKAIALLLNTDPEHDQFYSNHLLACLSAILQPAGCQGNAHSTLKLVATHLIASGHIWQGVEILILNGQVLDACRYLQANHMWEDSARVAKLLLMDPAKKGVSVDGSTSEPGDGSEIWQRWASQLAHGRMKFAATLVLISVGAWYKAADLLIQQQMHDSAALLLRSVEQAGLYQPKDATELDFVHGIYRNFAQLLYESGWRSQAKEWASLCGQQGKQLLDEWNFLNLS